MKKGITIFILWFFTWLKFHSAGGIITNRFHFRIIEEEWVKRFYVWNVIITQINRIILAAHFVKYARCVQYAEIMGLIALVDNCVSLTVQFTKWRHEKPNLWHLYRKDNDCKIQCNNVSKSRSPFHTSIY